MFRYMGENGIRAAKIYLDQPVSNSGRLAALIRERGVAAGVETEVELRPDVDRTLYGREAVVTTDAIILDHCLQLVQYGALDHRGGMCRMPGFTGWGVRYRRKCGTSGAGGNVKWGKQGRFESGAGL